MSQCDILRCKCQLIGHCTTVHFDRDIQCTLDVWVLTVVFSLSAKGTQGDKFCSVSNQDNIVNYVCTASLVLVQGSK